MNAQSAILNDLLAPVGDCLTPETAKQLVRLRASDAVQVHIQQLAAKSNEGTLTEAERAEYETLISTGTFIAILQSKARKILNENKPT